MKVEENNMNTKKTISKKGILITAAVIGVLLVIYIAGSIFFQSHYLPRTVINGVSATGKTASGMKNSIKEKVKNLSLIHI